MTKNKNYIDVCVVKRCGEVIGNNKDCCDKIKHGFIDKFWNEEKQKYDECFISKHTVLNHIWKTINHTNCLLMINNYCLTRYSCYKCYSHCYPITKSNDDDIITIDMVRKVAIIICKEYLKPIYKSDMNEQKYLFHYIKQFSNNEKNIVPYNFTNLCRFISNMDYNYNSDRVDQLYFKVTSEFKKLLYQNQKTIKNHRIGGN